MTVKHAALKHAGHWHLLIPIKGGAGAKSRLRVPPTLHGGIAEAIARDTTTAAVAALPAGHVHVVTRDAEVAAWAIDVGAAVITPEVRGLNQEVWWARSTLVRQVGPVRVAALLGDVPALHAEDLTVALGEASHHPRSFVPDHSGVGTVLLAALPDLDLDPRFGPDSAHEHESSGAVRLDLDLPRLRTDVDDSDSLAAAARLGLGPSTTAIWRAVSGGRERGAPS